MSSTDITIKVVSTLTSLKVSDLLGVETRKDIKRISRIIGSANDKKDTIKNTYSVMIEHFATTSEQAAIDARESQINVVGSIALFLDRENKREIERKIRIFHDTVKSEKQKLLDEYGTTTVPADRYRQYLSACRDVEITYWKCQCVVTKISDTPFEGGSLNSESGKYHATSRTKTIVTDRPLTMEYLLETGICVTYEDDNGKPVKDRVQIADSSAVSYKQFARKASGGVYLTEAKNDHGETVLVLRKRE